MRFLEIKKQDNRTKIERLYYAYRDIMYTVAYNILKDRYLAEDAVHESFIRVINNLHKINENDCHKTKSFLIIICRHVSYDIYNRNKNIELNPVEEFGNTYIDTSDQPIDLLINEDSLRDLIDTIKKMKPIYSDVILLRYSHDLSIDEIANFLNIKTNTVRKRLERAKKMLINILKREAIM